MRSIANLLNYYTSLTQNTTANNQNLGLGMFADQHRILLEQYFDNERTYQTTTVGGQSLTLTGGLSAGATSATLTAVWTNPTVTQLVNFSDGEQRSVLFTNNSTAITWQGTLTGAVTSAITTVGVQAYSVPSQISKIKNTTWTIGQLRFTPKSIQTRADWDVINTLPYASDIPGYYYLYGGTLQFWPIPASTGDLITFSYQARVPDFTFLWQNISGTWSTWSAGNTPSDYQKGTITSATVGSTSITGSSTAWNATAGLPLNTDISYYNLYFRIDPPYGDGIWYPISQINSDTSLTLATPIANIANITGATYSIGQMPVLSEDFHDMLAYWALKIYFSTIVENQQKYKQFEALYIERKEYMESYLGTKSLNVNLGGELQYRNPNLYPYAQPGQ